MLSDDELDELIEREGSSATMSILDLDLAAADPTARQIVAAYRRWLGMT